LGKIIVSNDCKKLSLLKTQKQANDLKRKKKREREREREINRDRL
jgi:hypothetical protein